MLEFKNELLVSIRQIAMHGTTQYGVSSMVRERMALFGLVQLHMAYGIWELINQCPFRPFYQS
jgi:hypothetical protein